MKIIKERDEETVKKFLCLLMQEDIYKFIKVNKIKEFDDCDLYRGEINVIGE